MTQTPTTPKNILYIAPYRQSCGWGKAAQAYGLALYNTGHNITTRPIYMANTLEQNINPILHLLEHNKQTHYDIIIQKVLPPLLELNNDLGYKNVAIGAFETNHIEHSLWPYYLNMMDAIIVPSHQDTKHLLDSQVTVPITVVLEPTDINIYTQTYNDTLYKQLGIHDKYTFYWIGEYTERKNLEPLIAAFHREFKPHENVQLMIKTNQANMPPQQLAQQLDKNFSIIKNNLRLYTAIERYKKEIIITEYIPDEQLYALHQSCDCLVITSRGESCCRPVLDAIGFGSNIIVTDCIGTCSYINHNISTRVPSIETPVYTSQRPLQNIYTGRETWQEINILDLQIAMRNAYNESAIDKVKRQDICKTHINKFSYDAIAETFNNFVDTII